MTSVLPNFSLETAGQPVYIEFIDSQRGLCSLSIEIAALPASSTCLM